MLQLFSLQKRIVPGILSSVKNLCGNTLSSLYKTIWPSQLLLSYCCAISMVFFCCDNKAKDIFNVFKIIALPENCLAQPRKYAQIWWSQLCRGLWKPSIRWTKLHFCQLHNSNPLTLWSVFMTGLSLVLGLKMRLPKMSNIEVHRSVCQVLWYA